MTDRESDILFRKIATVLDQSVANLDKKLTGRLDLMRQQALSRAPEELQHETGIPPILKHLDRSLETIDTGIQQKLTRIRQQALRQELKSSGWQTIADWFGGHRLAFPASAIATACIMVTAVTLFYRAPGSSVPTALDEDLFLFASAADFELYENLEFYLWLAENGSLN